MGHVPVPYDLKYRWYR